MRRSFQIEVEIDTEAAQDNAGTAFEPPAQDEQLESTGILSEIGKLAAIEADPALVSRQESSFPNEEIPWLHLLIPCRNEIKRAFQQEHIEMLMGAQAWMGTPALLAPTLSHQKQASIAESDAAQLAIHGTAPSRLVSSRGFMGAPATEPVVTQPTPFDSHSPLPEDPSESKVVADLLSPVPEPTPLPDDQNRPEMSVSEGYEARDSPFIAVQRQEGSDVEQPLIQDVAMEGVDEDKVGIELLLSHRVVTYST